jgi:hypothetical protein
LDATAVRRHAVESVHGHGSLAFVDASVTFRCAACPFIHGHPCAAIGGFGNRVKGLTHVLAACIARRSICAFHWQDPHPLRAAFDSAALAALDWRLVNTTFRQPPSRHHFEACLSHSRDVEDSFASYFEWMMADRSLRPSIIPPSTQPQLWFLSYPCAEHHFGWAAYPHSLQTASLSLLSLISSAVDVQWEKQWGSNRSPGHSSAPPDPVMDVLQLHAVLLSAVFSPSAELLLQQQPFLQPRSSSPAPDTKYPAKMIAVGCGASLSPLQPHVASAGAHQDRRPQLRRDWHAHQRR